MFGRDPEAYARARLPYPNRVYDILRSRCGLRAGAAVFEIGPGTGIATRELLRWGANPLTLVERDRRLAGFLSGSLGPGERRVTMRIGPFERAVLRPRSFDLGVAATSFHWLPERPALRKIAGLLKPGGWWASWNTYHGDPFRPTPFQRALRPLYRELAGGRSPRRSAREAAARDRRQRLDALRSVERFDRISREDIHWSVTLEAAHIRALWGTFSDIVTLPPGRRERFLNQLEGVVNEQFGGRARIAVLTPMHTARRQTD